MYSSVQVYVHLRMYKKTGQVLNMYKKLDYKLGMYKKLDNCTN